jgi:predicted amidohydrolase
MKVALIQMLVNDDKEKNLNKACEKIREASRNGVDIVILPEMFSCPYETKKFPIYAEEERGPSWTKLSEIAKENNIYLVAGSIPEKDEDRIYNTSFVFDRTGKNIAKHRKIHLFDIAIKGGQYFKESDTLTAGNSITTFDTEFGKMGLMICFDIRFCELSRLMALEGVKAIFVPGAFNMTTGPAHWQLHFKARALDNQVFFAGCSPARDMDSSYIAYGHSMTTSPWGDILDIADEKEQIIYSEFDLSSLDSIREQLPIIKSRRTDIYQITTSKIE